MNVVIAMAGGGSRFRAAGVMVPKPLISVRGRPMLAWALGGLPLTDAETVTFVCQRDHLQNHPLADAIRSIMRRIKCEYRIVALDRQTDGQACSVLAGAEHVPAGAPLLIHNADTYVSFDAARLGYDARAEQVDGTLLVSRAVGDHWSFVRVDEKSHATAIAEKRRIAEWCSTGTYYFRRTSTFLDQARAMVAAHETVNGEYFVAPVYSRMMADGQVVSALVADKVIGLGTPEELARFEAEHEPIPSSSALRGSASDAS